MNSRSIRYGENMIWIFFIREKPKLRLSLPQLTASCLAFPSYVFILKTTVVGGYFETVPSQSLEQVLDADPIWQQITLIS